MLKKLMVSTLAIAVIAIAYSAYAEEKAKFSAKCPISGKAAKQGLDRAWNGLESISAKRSELVQQAARNPRCK